MRSFFATTIQYRESTGEKFKAKWFGRLILKLRYRDLVDVRSFFVSGSRRSFLVENFRVKMLPLLIAEDAIEWDKALACLAWVSKNVKFVPDDRECWQMPGDTAGRLVGDCEDGAILLANMLLALGLEPKKVKVVCGSLSSGVGHCVVEFNGVQLDWLHLARIEKAWFKFTETEVEICKN